MLKSDSLVRIAHLNDRSIIRSFQIRFNKSTLTSAVIDMLSLSVDNNNVFIRKSVLVRGGRGGVQRYM